MLACSLFPPSLSAVGRCSVLLVVVCRALIMFWLCLLFAGDCMLVVVVACCVLLVFVVVCYFGVYDWLLLFVALLFYVLFADRWSLFVVCRFSMVLIGCCLLHLFDGCCLFVAGCGFGAV